MLGFTDNDKAYATGTTIADLIDLGETLRNDPSHPVSTSQHTAKSQLNALRSLAAHLPSILNHARKSYEAGQQANTARYNDTIGHLETKLQSERQAAGELKAQVDGLRSGIAAYREKGLSEEAVAHLKAQVARAEAEALKEAETLRELEQWRADAGNGPQE